MKHPVSRRFLRKAQAGFSLMELMVVVIIIGILAAIGINQFSGDGAKAVKLYSQMNAIRDAVMRANQDTGTWPLNVQALVDPNSLTAANWSSGRAVPASSWKGPYLSDLQVVAAPVAFPAAGANLGGATIAAPAAGAALMPDAGSAASAQLTRQDFADAGRNYRRYIVAAGPISAELASSFWSNCNKTNNTAPVTAFPAAVNSGVTCAVRVAGENSYVFVATAAKPI